MKRKEPQWLSRVVVDAVHLDQLREHGGLLGMRDENALEAALMRPRQKWNYDETVDVVTLGGAYCYGLVTNHPYQDGNKRIGFLAMVTFLGLNGYAFHATDSDVVTEIVALAGGRRSEKQLVDWVRRQNKKLK